MPKPLDAAVRDRITRLLALEWRPAAIARVEQTSVTVVYNIQANLRSFGSSTTPRLRQLGAPRLITRGAGRLLQQHLHHNPWMYQDEMAEFLWTECGIECSQSTISRWLDKNRVSNKNGERLSDRQNEVLRAAYRAEVLDVIAESMVKTLSRSIV